MWHYCRVLLEVFSDFNLILLIFKLGLFLLFLHFFFILIFKFLIRIFLLFLVIDVTPAFLFTHFSICIIKINKMCNKTGNKENDEYQSNDA